MEWPHMNALLPRCLPLLALATLAALMSALAAPSRAADEKPPADIAKSDPATQELVTRLLFTDDPAERQKLRRELRLSLVPKPPEPPAANAPDLNPIDAFIAAKWKQSNLPEAEHPPELCDDASFQRRAYLDLIGVIPTAADAQKFVADPSPDKRAKLIDALLARNDDYAANWTPFWQDALGSATNAGVGGV